MAGLTRAELETIISNSGPNSNLLDSTPDQVQSRINTADSNRIIAELKQQGLEAKAEAYRKRKKTEQTIKELEAQEAAAKAAKPKAGSTAEGKTNISDLFKDIPGVSDIVKDIIGSF
jgi:hypothetical protein